MYCHCCVSTHRTADYTGFFTNLLKSGDGRPLVLMTSTHARGLQLRLSRTSPSMANRVRKKRGKSPAFGATGRSAASNPLIGDAKLKQLYSIHAAMPNPERACP